MKIDDFYNNFDTFEGNVPDGEAKPPEEKQGLVDPIFFDEVPSPCEEKTKLVDPIIFDEFSTPPVEEQMLNDSTPSSAEGGAPTSEGLQPEEEKLSPVDFRALIAEPEIPVELLPNLGESEGILNHYSGGNTFTYNDNRSISFIQGKGEEPRNAASFHIEGDQETLSSPRSAIGRERITQFDLAEKVKRLFTLKIFRHCLYVYTGQYFQHLPREDALIFIYGTCKEEVSVTGNYKIIEGAYNLLCIDPDLQIKAEKVNDQYMAFQNGLLRLSDGVLCPHTKSIFLTSMVKANYIVGLSLGPVSQKFFESVACGNPNIKKLCFQMIGYCLTPDMSAKKLFVFRGKGDSGKTTLVNLVTGLLPSSCVASLDLNSIGQRFKVAGLIGKAICTLPDTTNSRLDSEAVSKLKQLTGNDLVPAEIKYGPTIGFFNTAKILITTNHTLYTEKPDEAFNNRLVVIPFQHSVPDGEKNRELEIQLLEERDAIVSVAMAAYFELRENQYRFAESGQIDVTGDDAQQNGGVPSISIEDGIKKFLEQNYTPCPGGVVFTEDVHKELMQVYPGLDYNTFSRYFGKLAEAVFDVKKDRQRRPGGKNPLSCVVGIRHI